MEKKETPEPETKFNWFLEPLKKEIARLKVKKPLMESWLKILMSEKEVINWL